LDLDLEKGTLVKAYAEPVYDPRDGSGFNQHIGEFIRLLTKAEKEEVIRLVRAFSKLDESLFVFEGLFKDEEGNEGAKKFAKNLFESARNNARYIADGFKEIVEPSEKDEKAEAFLKANSEGLVSPGVYKADEFSTVGVIQSGANLVMTGRRPVSEVDELDYMRLILGQANVDDELALKLDFIIHVFRGASNSRYSCSLALKLLSKLLNKITEDVRTYERLFEAVSPEDIAVMTKGNKEYEELPSSYYELSHFAVLDGELLEKVRLDSKIHFFLGLLVRGELRSKDKSNLYKAILHVREKDNLIQLLFNDFSSAMTRGLLPLDDVRSLVFCLLRGLHGKTFPEGSPLTTMRRTFVGVFIEYLCNHFNKYKAKEMFKKDMILLFAIRPLIYDEQFFPLLTLVLEGALELQWLEAIFPSNYVEKIFITYMNRFAAAHASLDELKDFIGKTRRLHRKKEIGISLANIVLMGLAKSFEEKKPEQIEKMKRAYSLVFPVVLEDKARLQLFDGFKEVFRMLSPHGEEEKVFLEKLKEDAEALHFNIDALLPDMAEKEKTGAGSRYPSFYSVGLLRASSELEGRKLRVNPFNKAPKE
jgi:hypothetical protein